MLLSQTDVPYGEENTFFITVAGGKLFSWWHFCSENIKLKMTNGFKYLKGQNEIKKKKDMTERVRYKKCSEIWSVKVDIFSLLTHSLFRKTVFNDKTCWLTRLIMTRGHSFCLTYVLSMSSLDGNMPVHFLSKRLQPIIQAYHRSFNDVSDNMPQVQY